MKAAVLKRPPSAISALPELIIRIRSNAAMGEDYRREVGKDLIEAKKLVPTGEWHMWLEDNFDWSVRTAIEYMKLARGGRARIPKNEPHKQLARATAKIAGSINYAALKQEQQDREKERQLMRSLGNKLIDIGFRVLAAKLHPDKPTGSEEAMQRLNTVKKLLQGAL